MKDIIEDIIAAAVEGIREIYQADVPASELLVTPTKKEHTGDYTLVTFALAKLLKVSPPQIANDLGAYMTQNRAWISGAETVQGFLNLTLANEYWPVLLEQLSNDPDFRKPAANGQKVLVEFSSPNTNKPLHLGHIRNILLGWSMSKVFRECGDHVYRVQIINDRGIAICKSMLAWKNFANGQTPQQAGIKSDHFVGHWYVRFEQAFQEEYKAWQESPMGQEAFANRKDKEASEKIFFKEYKNQYFNTYSTLGKEARELLLKWEANDPETIALWKMMNQWVYDGFEETYKRLGVEFDKLYYESDTYLLGKDIIETGLERGSFYKKPDGSVWVDLTDHGLDHKLLLRADGTSVYMTQDLGTAHLRYEEFGAEKMVYVVADEQNYHFQALFAIMDKLNEPYAKGLHHLSYGMIDLTEGKMKSREGTVVDADDLMDEVITEAGAAAAEREMSDHEVVRKIGMAALKYFIIKVDPRKRMIFDPQASIDLQGQTGPYIQNAFVRIQSILRKAPEPGPFSKNYEANSDEKLLLSMLCQCSQVITAAAKDYSPALIANYAYALAKEYHRYYHDVKVIQAESEAAKNFRLHLIRIIGETLQHTMDLLGIEMPDRM